MDVHVRSRRSARETSPDRVKACMTMQQQQQNQKPLKVVKPTRRSVKVVYYLTRNGQLEHPHYMEITLLPNNPLRLRDFMDRLTVLRGKGMPYLYSWSSKRSYKNGYVWNDLVENDVIYPSDGAEYVLKGSELLEGRFQHVQKQETNNTHIISSKPKPSITNQSRNRAAQETEKTTAYEDQAFVDDQEQVEEEEEEEEEDYEDEEKSSYTCSTTPHSRCSRGVSTDELEEDQDQEPNKIHPMTISIQSTQLNSTPPPLQSSSILSDKNNKANSNSTSQRFEDGDPIAPESATSRNSVLLHLISCGNLAVAKAKNNVPTTKQPSNSASVKPSENLRRGVLCKSAAKAVDDDKDMIIYMSENPRFGNLQAEEKEYFSGSIVESMSEDRVAAEPVLKKSNSYNDERRKTKSALEEAEKGVEEEKRSEKSVNGKCIPRKKSATKQTGKK